MAGIDLNSIKRDEVAAIAADADLRGIDRGSHIAAVLEQRYPGIANATVRRGQQVFKVLDYLIADAGSYGPSS